MILFHIAAVTAVAFAVAAMCGSKFFSCSDY
jgi:hypothetical protein